MTTFTTPARRAPRRGSGHGSLAWLTLPALVIFIGFGVIPLIGVLVLSFTTWDGIGAITPSGFDSWRAVLSDPGLPHALWV
ncbi:MAG TPA: sugar ABC transporter permease, partial [Thermoanaerobaculia bacterium]|nr:sugar ABC transporter permease [Thermoanaerobaculia bacterium]